MLSAEENQLLCRVGSGTPMGTVFRRYWLPALRSVDLPGPDCTPFRVRLLGEDLVAFRDSDGRVGLLAERCSHRGISLFYGRNEEGGLRCIYHGWAKTNDYRDLITINSVVPTGVDWKEFAPEVTTPQHAAVR